MLPTDPKTVLLVEDEQFHALATTICLQRQGFRVVCASNGEDAVTKARAIPQIDLILMDINLGPGIDGIETAQRILQERYIPVVFLSGQTDPQILARTEKIASYGYVHKGSGDTVLLASIKMAFRLHEANCQLEERQAQLEHALAEQWLAENDLRRSEHENRLTLEATTDGVWKWNVKTHETFFSPRYYTMLGYEVDEFPATYENWAGLLHPNDQAKAIQVLHKFVAEGGTYENEFRLRAKNGTYRYIHAHASVVERDANGEVVRVIGNHKDITERKRDEAIMMARLHLAQIADQHSLSQLLQAMLDEICELTESPVGFFHFVEPDQKTLSLQAWSTRTLQEFCHVTGELQHYDIAAAGVWVDCVYQKQPVIHNDYASLPHRRGLPEGHAPVVRELVVPILRNDLIVAIIGIGNKEQDYGENDVAVVSQLAELAWDITERKRAEDALRNSLETNKLLLRELQHRIKNSMSIITGIIGLEVDAAVEVETVHVLGSVRDRIQTLSNLYTLLYSSGDSQDVQLDDYFYKIVDSLRATYIRQSDNFNLEVNCDALVVDVRLATSLGLILNELLTNAIKYAYLKYEDGKVWVKLQKVGDQALVEVANNGESLPKDFRLETCRGLGLQLVQILAIQHKGTFTFESNGKTTFRVIVPLNSAE